MKTKHIKELFDKRFPSPHKISFPLQYVRLDEEILRQDKWKKFTTMVQESAWISILDIHINANKSVIVFRIEVNDFQMLKEWNNDKNIKIVGAYLSSGMEKHYFDVLRFLNNPRVMIDVVGMHPLENKIF